MILTLLFALSPDALDKAITELNKVKCDKPLSTQAKAARMQLELMREVKDFNGAESMTSTVSDLIIDAKKTCPSSVPALEAALTNLRGGNAVSEPPDADIDPEPKLVSPPMKNKERAKVPQSLQGTLDELAKTLGPSWHELEVKGSDKNRMDWAEPLMETKCYAFIAVAAPSAKRIAVYLFDPQGKRRSERKGKTASAVMYHCAGDTGDYRLQARVKKPGEGYIIATYVRE